MLALAVTRGCLTQGYGVIPGNSWEEDGFIPTLRTVCPEIARAVTIADAGMSRKENPDGLEAQDRRFVSGGLLRNLPQFLVGRVLETTRIHSVHGSASMAGFSAVTAAARWCHLVHSGHARTPKSGAGR